MWFLSNSQPEFLKMKLILNSYEKAQDLKMVETILKMNNKEVIAPIKTGSTKITSKFDHLPRGLTGLHI